MEKITFKEGVKKYNKLKEICEKLDAPIKSNKWKNLAFTKDGKSYLGPRSYNSEEEALKQHLKVKKQAELSIKLGLNPYNITSCGTILYWKQRTFTMQIPLTES